MNLHDELGRFGADGASGSAERLSSDDVRESLGARVRSGRRRRAVGGGMGAVAGIALVALGVWAAVPFFGVQEVEPAEPDSAVSAGPFRYDIVPGADVVDGPPQVVLTGDNAVMCGDELSLAPGVTVHDPVAYERAIWVAAELTTSEALGVGEESRRYADYAPPADAFLQSDPEPALWHMGLGGDTVRWEVVPLLMDGGVVAGTSMVAGSESDVEHPGMEEASAMMQVPGDGQCGALLGGDGAERGNPMDSVLVVQFWTLSEGEEAVLAATVVIDPNGPVYDGEGPQLPEDFGPEVEAPADFADLPAHGTDDYLASPVAVREWMDGLSCSAILDGVGEGADLGPEVGEAGPLPPVPSWIETGRLYGWGDDVLVGGYPIPVATASEGWELPWADPARPESADPAVLVLSAGGEYWVFDVRWLELGDPEHDGPGWFIELTPNWECGTAQLITEGVYDAQLLFGGAGDQLEVELSPISVLAGVPSLPEVDAQG